MVNIFFKKIISKLRLRNEANMFLWKLNIDLILWRQNERINELKKLFYKRLFWWDSFLLPVVYIYIIASRCNHFCLYNLTKIYFSIVLSLVRKFVKDFFYCEGALRNILVIIELFIEINELKRNSRILSYNLCFNQFYFPIGFLWE